MINLKDLPNIIDELLNQIFDENNLRDETSLFDYYISKVEITFDHHNKYKVTVYEYSFINTDWLTFTLEDKDLESKEVLKNTLTDILLNIIKNEKTDDLIEDVVFYFKKYLNNFTEKEFKESFSLNFKYNSLNENYEISRL